MTKVGVVFIVSGVFVYFLASQTQIGWVYLFDAVIWSLLVLAFVVTRYSLKSLKVERQILLSRSVETGLNGPLEDEKIEVKLRVTNHGRVARHFIRVLEDCPFAPPAQRNKFFFIPRLEPKSTVTFGYEVECYRRGYYPSAEITLQASDPLGLVARKKSRELPLDLTVYPAYYAIEAVPVADATWAEWGQVVRSSAAEELYGSREYQYGDSLRHIHWRNTARLGQFMLKEFEQSRQAAITIIFRTGHEYGQGRETTLEYSIKIAASLAKMSADLGRRVNIVAGERPLYQAGWREAMEYLARLKAKGSSELLEAVVPPEPGRVVVAVASAKDTRLIPVVERLAGWGKGTVVLLEGFAPEERPEEFFSQLRDENTDIIRCSPGNLEATVRNLSSSRFFGGKPAVV